MKHPDDRRRIWQRITSSQPYRRRRWKSYKKNGLIRSSEENKRKLSLTPEKWEEAEKYLLVFGTQNKAKNEKNS